MRLRYIAVTVLCLFASMAMANTQWYQVELLIFENNDPKGLSEHWPLEPDKPNYRNIAYLKRHKDNERDNFQLLPRKEYKLTDAKQRLTRDGHRMVFHRAWIQQIEADKQNKSLHLIGGKRYKIHEQPSDFSHGMTAQQNISGKATVRKQYEMDGIITLNRGRYLHVDADFVFHKPMQVIKEASARGGYGSRLPQQNNKSKLAFVGNNTHWQDHPNSRLQPLRFHQTRRMKSNEVHYLDHPFYGILISIVPVKETGAS